MIRFADPWYFTLLVLIIPVIIFGRYSGGRLRFSNLELFKGIRSISTIHPRLILLVLRVLTLILLITGLARPQAGRKFSEILSEGVDIVLAIDTSKSMEAMDFKIDGKRVDRLDVVKRVVGQFIKKRPNDRMGLVVFGEEAYTQCPLTLDHGILIEFLKKVEIDMVGGRATAIGSAIGTSVNRLKDLKSKAKLIILLTDGRNNAGELTPLKSADLASVFKIKIYAIGAGTKGKAPFLVDSFFGKQYVYQNVEIDEETLTEMAKITGGRYFRATDTKELEKIYKEIDKLEKTKIKMKEYTEYNELFYWFLIPGLILLLLEILLSQTRLRKIP